MSHRASLAWLVRWRLLRSRTSLRASLAVLGGCSLGLEPVVDTTAPEPTWTVADLWAGIAAPGAVSVEVVVTSPRLTTASVFYAQAPGGGPRSGLAVGLAGVLDAWPPAPGTPAVLTGGWQLTDEGPLLTIDANDDGSILGDPIDPVITPWDGDPGLASGLIVLDPLTLTSEPDPLGLADTDGSLAAASCFGDFLPGAGNPGALAGILVGGRVCPRARGDWRGPRETHPPQPATIAQLRDGAFADGAQVVLSGVVQATPWSRSGRYALLQDELGDGVWVDTEGFAGLSTAEGDVGDWQGEVRGTGGLRLRVWRQPEVTGTDVPRRRIPLEDGNLVLAGVTGVSGPDAFGDWRADGGVVLDDRFLELVDLPEQLLVVGAVREANGRTAIAVTQLLP